MSDVFVPYGDNASETATLLLEAAEKSKDHEQGDVRTVEGGFLVDEKIAKSAGVDYESDEDEADDKDDDQKPPAKKATAAKK